MIVGIFSVAFLFAAFLYLIWYAFYNIITEEKENDSK